MTSQITFTGWQLEDAIYREMVKDKEVGKTLHTILMEPTYEGSKINGINVIAQEKLKKFSREPKTDAQVHFTLEQVETILYKKMVLSKEIPNTNHMIKLDFKLSQEQDKTIIESVDVTANEFKAKLKP